MLAFSKSFWKLRDAPGENRKVPESPNVLDRKALSWHDAYMTSTAHHNCCHPSTKAARTACRKEMKDLSLTQDEKVRIATAHCPFSINDKNNSFYHEYMNYIDNAQEKDSAEWVAASSARDLIDGALSHAESYATEEGEG
jgi:hypothetical protein